MAMLPTGIAIQPPPGMEAQIRPRSSFSRQGIDKPFGTIDADYRGELFRPRLHSAARPGASGQSATASASPS